MGQPISPTPCYGPDGIPLAQENLDFLGRVYGAEEIDLSLPPCLVILSQDIPSGAPEMCNELCTVPMVIYRYSLFGSGEDPDISIEGISLPDRETAGAGENLPALRRDLGIETAMLSDQDIRDFRAAMGF